MDVKDFYFELPQELIAQDPLEDRSSSRLLVLDKDTGAVQHRIFKNITEYLRPGDCLVINDTRVIPARLFGVKRDTGAKVVLETVEDGNRLIQFHYEGIFEEILDQLGQMPLPPYITHSLKDKNRYQTVYARHDGSAAAPTAGLHFTEELLKQIEEMGVRIAHVTLHVGLGTFRPVKVEHVLDHHMHSEFYMVEEAEAKKVNEAKEAGGRVICVGTTSCRTVESASTEDGILKAGTGWTDIFIYPGYRFKVLDALITNFHLPESTLVMLVSALAGREHILDAYKEAVKERYRFFSFGDAMLIASHPEAKGQ